MLSDNFALGLKFIIGLGSLFCTYFMCNWKRPFKIPLARFIIMSVALLFAIRLSLFILVFVVFKIPATSDVTVYYLQAKSALSGMAPYRDFATSGGILFPYICGLPLLIWNSPKVIILFSITIELLSLTTWLLIAKRLFDDYIARLATLLYLFNPIILFNTGISGQFQVWPSFLCGLSIYLLLSRKEATSFFTFLFALMSTKIMALFYLPSLLFMAKRKITWLLSLLSSGIIIYAIFLSKRIDLLYPLKVEISNRSSGNISFFLTLLPIKHSIFYNHYLFIAACLSLQLMAIKIFWKRFFSGNKGASIYMVSAVLLIFMLFSFKASSSNYLVICFYPLCISVASLINTKHRKREIILFGIFSLIATIELSLWFRWMRQSDFRMLWQCPPDLALMKVYLFLFVEALLISFYSYYLKRVLGLGIFKGSGV